MVDVDRILKNTIKKGKVKIGARQTKKALEENKAKMVVLANNCPYYEQIAAAAEKKKIPLYHYNSKSVELGYACGKNFPVSALAVLDEGETNIVQLLVKKRQS
ncbi:MAG: 50S ribosomal protein L30e [Thermoplasmata archaeon]|nr:MAG: 50S ribosomal protein L30e [Thermoplasmata archaeon]